MVHITLVDAVINHGCHQQRNNRFHYNLQNHKKRCKNRFPDKALNMYRKGFNHVISPFFM